MDLSDINNVTNRKRMNTEVNNETEIVPRENAKIIKLKLQQNPVDVQMQYHQKLRRRPDALNQAASTWSICSEMDEYSARLKANVERSREDAAELAAAYEACERRMREVDARDAAAATHDDLHTTRTLLQHAQRAITEKDEAVAVVRAEAGRSSEELAAAKQATKEEQAAAKRAAEEELAAAKRAAEEELATTKRATKELAAVKQATEEELAATKRASVELAAAKQAAVEVLAAAKRATEELAAVKRATEEELAVAKRATEELATAKQAADEELVAVKRATEELVAAKQAAEEEFAAAKKAAKELAVAKRAAEGELAAAKRATEELAVAKRAIEEAAKRATEELAVTKRIYRPTGEAKIAELKDRSLEAVKSAVMRLMSDVSRDHDQAQRRLADRADALAREKDSELAMQKRLQERMNALSATVNNLQKELMGRAPAASPSPVAERNTAPAAAVAPSRPLPPTHMYDFLSDSSEGDTVDAHQVQRRFEAPSRARRADTPVPRRSPATISTSQAKNETIKTRKFFKNKRSENKGEKPK